MNTESLTQEAYCTFSEVQKLFHISGDPPVFSNVTTTAYTRWPTEWLCNTTTLQQLHIPGDPQTGCVTLQLHIPGDPQTGCVTLQQQLHIPGDQQTVWLCNTTTTTAYTRWPTECLAGEHNSYCICQVTHRVFGWGRYNINCIYQVTNSVWLGNAKTTGTCVKEQHTTSLESSSVVLQLSHHGQCCLPAVHWV